MEAEGGPSTRMRDGRAGGGKLPNGGGGRVAKGEGALSVFEAGSLTLLKTLPVPPHPNSLALDTVNKALFVTVKNDGDATKANKPESVVRVTLK